MKQCKSCGSSFPVNFNQRYCSDLCAKTFRKQQAKEGKASYYNRNKDKIKKSSKAWYEANKERASVRSKAYRQANKEAIAGARFIAKYGITSQEYKELESSQSGVCAICWGKDRDCRNRPLSVDHDHSTGKVRGLLCGHCNKALGLLNDNLSTVEKAFRYMEKHYQNPTD